MAAFDDQQLIFLVSQPRAGSTLLQHILAGHELIHSTAEPWLMLHPVYALREEGHSAEYNARYAHNALKDFLQTLPDGQDAYWKALRLMTLELYGQACSTSGKTLFVDKTPRYYYILKELAHIFPAARFIILLRNPLAVLHSMLETWVQGRWPRLAPFRDDLLQAPGLLVEGVSFLGERARVVAYERLVTEPEQVTAALCAWLGVVYDPQMLAYGERQRLPGRYGDAVGLARHKRPSAASLDNWLALGQTPQMRHLAESYLDALGPELLAQMGYPAGELTGRLATVPLQPGKVVIRWSQLFPPGEKRPSALHLVWAGLRQTGNLREAARQLWHLYTGRQ